MIITDKEVIKWVKIARNYWLTEDLDEFEEDDRGGRDDKQILADEVSWRLSCYTEGGTSIGDEYDEAVEYIKETKNGKQFRINPNDPVRSLDRAKRKYNECKEVVNEYNRLVSLKKRLEARGYKGRW